MKRLLKIWSCALIVILISAFSLANAFADNLSGGDYDYFLTQEPEYVAENGNSLMYIEEAELIEDKDALIEIMKPILEYGNVMFLSCSKGNNKFKDAHRFSGEVLSSYFTNQNNSTVLLIDMDTRKIYVRTYGDISKILTDTKAEVITDNIYKYATNADYDRCAQEAFDQMYKVIDGQRIAAPMHYIGAALISVILAMIICFIIISRSSTKKKPGDRELMKGTDTSIMLTNVTAEYIKTVKTKVARSSGGGGGSFFSGGGSSGGGGWSSGGGGGGWSGGGGGGGSSGGSGGGHSF